MVAEFIVVKQNNCCPILGLETCLDLELIQRINAIKSSSLNTQTSSSFQEKKKNEFVNKIEMSLMD